MLQGDGNLVIQYLGQRMIYAKMAPAASALRIAPGETYCEMNQPVKMSARLYFLHVDLHALDMHYVCLMYAL